MVSDYGNFKFVAQMAFFYTGIESREKLLEWVVMTRARIAACYSRLINEKLLCSHVVDE